MPVVSFLFLSLAIFINYSAFIGYIDPHQLLRDALLASFPIIVIVTQYVLTATENFCRISRLFVPVAVPISATFI